MTIHYSIRQYTAGFFKTRNNPAAKILLLELNSFCNLTLVIHASNRSDYQFVLAIISPADCCDNLAIKFGDRLRNTQDICILFFSISGNNTGNVAVINRINDVPMQIVNRPIYHNMDNLTYLASIFSSTIWRIFFSPM